jgi:sporulation protein YlmC with PRC-barrel domain
MRLSDLRNAKVKSLDGETLGRIHEVHSEGGRIVAVTCGAGSWIESLTTKSGGRRIPWECVVKIAHKQVFITPDPPQRKPRPGASRTPQGTRRPTGRPSKR